MVHDLLKIFQMLFVVVVEVFAILDMIGWPQHSILHIDTLIPLIKADIAGTLIHLTFF